MFLQVLLGIDLPSESKMNSDGEGRPGECKSMLRFRIIFLYLKDYDGLGK